MARMRVEARPGEGVNTYSLYVDGLPASMATCHAGEAVCDGLKGDGSSHSLIYSFNGRPGATFGVSLWCGLREVCRLPEARIASGKPWCAGRETFEL